MKYVIPMIMAVCIGTSLDLRYCWSGTSGSELLVVLLYTVHNESHVMLRPDVQ